MGRFWRLYTVRQVGRYEGWALWAKETSGKMFMKEAFVMLQDKWEKLYDALGDWETL